ncbi:MAG TPA: CBS domain-containing protein [Thermomicrobiales bacterium]|nr:CBS domain-containing protein [Thermomicrobiales bacterium]
MRVTEIMTPDVVTVGPDTPINEVARVMVEYDISGVPVVDDGGALVGIITEFDMIARQADYDAPISTVFFDALIVMPEPHGEEKLRKILATRAEELMTRTVYSIREDASIEEVASLMYERKVNPVPVVSFDGTVIGIVSRSDIVRLMVREVAAEDGLEGEREAQG